jgi:hypothetical protein
MYARMTVGVEMKLGPFVYRQLPEQIESSTHARSAASLAELS